MLALASPILRYSTRNPHNECGVSCVYNQVKREPQEPLWAEISQCSTLSKYFLVLSPGVVQQLASYRYAEIGGIGGGADIKVGVVN